jgi:hypothetical protein
MRDSHFMGNSNLEWVYYTGHYNFFLAVIYEMEVDIVCKNAEQFEWFDPEVYPLKFKDILSAENIHTVSEVASVMSPIYNILLCKKQTWKSGYASIRNPYARDVHICGDKESPGLEYLNNIVCEIIHPANVRTENPVDHMIDFTVASMHSHGDIAFVGKGRGGIYGLDGCAQVR